MTAVETTEVPDEANDWTCDACGSWNPPLTLCCLDCGGHRSQTNPNEVPFMPKEPRYKRILRALQKAKERELKKGNPGKCSLAGIAKTYNWPEKQLTLWLQDLVDR